MGQALELISGYATHPGATFTALTMSGSDSLTVRSFQMPDKAFVAAMWAYTQTIGQFRLRSPRMHDNVRGIQIGSAIKTSDPSYWGSDFLQPLYAQDTLIGEVNATGDGAGNLEYGAALIYYTNLPGVSANLIGPNQLAKLGQQAMGQWCAITTGAGGGYTGSQAVNVSADNWQANLWYALVGAVVDVNCVAVRVQGVDIGNLGVGIPGNFATPSLGSRWFTELSNQYGLPLIPCFNSANKSGIFVSCAQDQGAAAVNVTLEFVLLGPTITAGQF